MPCVVWSSDLTSNIDKNTEAYQFLQEINKHYRYEKVVVKENVIWSGIVNRKRHVNYGIYIKISDSEYQKIMVFQTLDLQDVECYLLGHLHGLGE